MQRFTREKVINRQTDTLRLHTNIINAKMFHSVCLFVTFSRLNRCINLNEIWQGDSLHSVEGLRLLKIPKIQPLKNYKGVEKFVLKKN